MTRVLLTATLVALVAIAASALTLALSDGAAARPAVLQQVPTDPLPPTTPVAVDPGAAAPGVPLQLSMRVGDTMVVEDAGVGCQVMLRNGRVAIECRRSGDVRGTYMSVFSQRGVKLARFRSDTAANVIVSARHGAGWRACGQRARVAHAGARMCR
jgi:hypothetical protein